jgi:hypothetical protein
LVVYVLKQYFLDPVHKIVVDTVRPDNRSGANIVVEENEVYPKRFQRFNQFPDLLFRIAGDKKSLFFFQEVEPRLIQQLPDSLQVGIIALKNRQDISVFRHSESDMARPVVMGIGTSE